MLPPISSMSSLDQPMGLAPMRIMCGLRWQATCAPRCRSVADLLKSERFFVGCACVVHLVPLAHLGHRHVPPVAAGLRGLERIGVDDDDGGAVVGLCAPRERFRVRRSENTFRAMAPREAACAAKSIAGRVSWRASFKRLLKLAPPVAICSRLMQPKPRLSRTTTVSFSPSMTEVAISELSIR